MKCSLSLSQYAAEVVFPSFSCGIYAVRMHTMIQTPRGQVKGHLQLKQGEKARYQPKEGADPRGPLLANGGKMSP